MMIAVEKLLLHSLRVLAAPSGFAVDVNAYEAAPEHSQSRSDLLARIERRLAANASFSTATRYYLQVHRDLSWVEELLNRSDPVSRP